MRIDVLAWVFGLLVGAFFGPWALAKLRGGPNTAMNPNGMPYGGSAGY